MKNKDDKLILGLIGLISLFAAFRDEGPTVECDHTPTKWTVMAEREIKCVELVCSKCNEPLKATGWVKA